MPIPNSVFANHNSLPTQYLATVLLPRLGIQDFNIPKCPRNYPHSYNLSQGYKKSIKYRIGQFSYYCNSPTPALRCTSHKDTESALLDPTQCAELHAGLAEFRRLDRNSQLALLRDRSLDPLPQPAQTTSAPADVPLEPSSSRRVICASARISMSLFTLNGDCYGHDALALEGRYSFYDDIALLTKTNFGIEDYSFYDRLLRVFLPIADIDLDISSYKYLVIRPTALSDAECPGLTQLTAALNSSAGQILKRKAPEDVIDLTKDVDEKTPKNKKRRVVAADVIDLTGNADE